MSLKSKKKKTAVSPLVRGSAAAGAAAQARAKKSTPKKQKPKQTVQPAKAAMSKAPVAKKKTTATSASGRNDAAVRQSYGQRAGTRTSSGAYKPTQSAAYNYKKAETKRSTISTDIKNQTKVKNQKPSVVSGPVQESRDNRDKRMRQSWSQRHPENQVQREQRNEKQRPKSYVPTKGMAIPNKGQSAYDAEIEDFTRKYVQAGKLNPNERAGIAQGPMKDKGPIDLSTARDYDTMLSGGTVPGKYIPDENKVGALEYNIRMMGQDTLSKPYAEEIFKNASPSEQAQLVKAARETVGFNEQTDRWAKEADKARANASAEEQGRVNDAISGTRRDQYGQVVNSREKLQDYIYRTSTDKYNSAVKQQQFVDQWAKEHGTTTEDYLRSRFNTGAGGFVQSVWDGLFLPAESVMDYDRPGYYLGGFKAPHEGISKDKNILQNSWQWYTNLTSDAITMALLPYKALFKNTAERSDNFRQGSQNLYDLAMKWTGQDERIVRQEALRRLNESMGKDQNPATQFVGDALEATVQMVPGMALSVVNPAVGMALFVESAGGMYARSALDNGASLEEALTYGTMCGALEGAVEKIFPFMGTYGRSFSGGMLAKMLGGRTTRGKVLFDSVVRDLSSNAFRQSMRGRILIGLGESLGEFTEEALMEVIEPFVRKSTYDAMADYASLEEIGMAGLLGAAIGVGLHAPSIGAATTGTLAKSVYISNQKLFAKAEYEDAVTRATNMADMGIISKELAERSIKEAKAIYDRNMAELAGVSGTGSLLDEERQGGEYKTSSNLEHLYSNRQEANAATVEPGTSAYFIEDGEVKRITHSEAGVKSEDAVLTNSEKTAYAEKAERLRTSKNNTERTGVQANVRQEIIDQAAEMARVYNRNVEFYRDEEAAKRYDDRGRFDPKTETIYVNAATDKPLQTIVSHEMVHAMRNTNAFKELLREIKTYYKDSYDADVNDIRRMYSERDENGNVIEPSEGIIQEEVVAHFVEKKLLTDEAWVNTFLTNSRTDKILRGINTLLQRGLGGKEARFLASVRSKWLNALEEERGEQTAPRAEAVTAAKERRAFGGVRARTADTSLLAKAKEMKEEGRSDEDILKETGWYVGADGQWRFEIDDSELIFDKRGLARNPDEARLKELENKMIFGSLSEEEAAEARELAQVVKAMRKPSKLSDYVKHDKLFAAYPELEDVTLKMMRPEDIERARGGYDDDNNVIYLNRTLSEDERRETLIHEIQHAIQGIEGFASGASPEYWSRRDSDAREDLARRQNSIIESLSDEDYRKYSEYTGMKRIVDGWIDVAGNLPVEEVIPDDETYNIWKQTAEESDRLYEELKEKDWFDELMELDEFLENPSKLHYNLYRNTAGEIEARDATNRLPLTAEERRNRMPDRGDEKTVFVEDVRSAKGSRDSEYLAAVERGDMETAQRLVDEAAEEALRSSKLRDKNGKLRRVFHGTNTGDFTVFNPDYIGMSSGDDGFFGRGFYFAYTKGEAGYYGARRIIPAYLDLKNPFNFETEIRTYNGMKGETGYAPSAISMINFAEKFPEIAKNVAIYENDKRISAIEFAEQLRDVLDNQKFTYETVHDSYSGRDEVLTLGNKEMKSYEYDGKTYEYPDYDYQRRWYEKPNPVDVAVDYLMQTRNISKIPSLTSAILDWNREFTQALKNMNYDGVIQSEDGDEAVVFEPSQIKSADPVTYDDDGNVIPLSERFNEENDDIRYARGMNALDEEYMAAVEAGNVSEQERLVREAAERAGYNVRAYHGTSRGDRVGNVFLPERATSGPMAFFTDNREIAKNYAKDKADTSLAYDSDYDTYESQFRFHNKSRSIDGKLHNAWGYVPLEDRAAIRRKAGQLRFDWDGEDDRALILDEENKEGTGGFQYHLKWARNNPILALEEEWLNSGTLFNEEERFLDVIKMVGITDALKRVGLEVEYKDPNYREEKVYDTFLKIEKPFDATKQVSEAFIKRFEKWYAKQNKAKYEKESNGADFWDKTNVSAELFAERMRYDIENGTTHAWTSIPDSMTDYLKHLKYDGIKDTGGKYTGEQHTVWIPFSSEQIKSAEPITRDKEGKVIPLSERFNPEEKDIRYAKGQRRSSEAVETAKYHTKKLKYALYNRDRADNKELWDMLRAELNKAYGIGAFDPRVAEKIIDFAYRTGYQLEDNGNERFSLREKISIPEEYRGEMESLGGLAAVNRSIFGTGTVFTYKNNGIAIDEAYDEARDMRPDLFPETDNPSEQVQNIVDALTKVSDKIPLEELDREEDNPFEDSGDPIYNEIRDAVIAAMDDIAAIGRIDMVNRAKREGKNLSAKAQYRKGRESGKKQGQRSGYNTAKREQDRTDRATMREFDKLERQRAIDRAKQENQDRRDDEATMREFDNVMKKVKQDERKLSQQEKKELRKNYESREKDIRAEKNRLIHRLRVEKRSWQDAAERMESERKKQQRSLDTKQRQEMRKKQQKLDEERRKERLFAALDAYEERKAEEKKGSAESLYKRNREVQSIIDEFRTKVLQVGAKMGAFKKEGSLLLDHNDVVIAESADGFDYVLKRDKNVVPSFSMTVLAEHEGMKKEDFYGIYAELQKMQNERDEKGNRVYAKRDILEYIVSLNIPAKHKSFLYFDVMKYRYDRKPIFKDGGPSKVKPGNYFAGELGEAIDRIGLDMFTGAGVKLATDKSFQIKMENVDDLLDMMFTDAEMKEVARTELVQMISDFEADIEEARMIEQTNLLTDNPKEVDSRKLQILGVLRDSKKLFLAEGEAFERFADTVKNPLLAARYYAAKASMSIARDYINGHGIRKLDGTKEKVARTKQNGDEYDVEFVDEKLSLTSIMKPALKGTKESDALLKDLTRYVYAQHNIDRMKYDKGFMELSEEECRAIIDEIGKNKQVVKMADDLVLYGQRLLRLCVESGVISEEDFEYFTTKYPHYVPTFRLREDEVFDRNGNIVKRTNKVIKEAQKSNADLIPLYDQMVRRTQEIVKACKKNQLAAELVKAYNKDGAWDYIIDVRPAEPTSGNEDYVYGIGQIEDRGLKNRDFDGEDNLIPVYLNGVKYNIAVADKNLLYGWDRLNYYRDESTIPKMMRKMNTLRRWVLTQYNPIFWATNGIKDSIDMYLYNQHAERLPLFQAKALSDIFHKKGHDSFAEYLSFGAASSSFFEYDERRRSKARKLKDKAAIPFKGIDFWNFLIEQWPRYTVYLEECDRLTKEREKGKNEYSDEEIKTISAYRAADATVNFGRSGTVVKAANTYGATFLNAGVQGMDRFRRMFTQVKGENKQETLLNILGLMIKLVAVGLAPSMIADWLYGGNDDDEDKNKLLKFLFGEDAAKVVQEYAEMADYERTNYLNIKLPGMDGWIRIPKGRVVSFIYGWEYNGEKVLSGDMSAMDLLYTQWDLFAENIMPGNPLTNNILQPVLDVAKNRDFWGNEIVSQWEQAQDGFHWTESNEDTSIVARKIAEYLHYIVSGGKEMSPEYIDLSPIKIDYLLQQYGGSWTKLAQPFISAIGDGQDQRFVDMIQDAFKDSMWGKFYLDPVLSNRLAGDYYDLKDEYTGLSDYYGQDTPYAVALKGFKDHDEDLKALRDELNYVSKDASLTWKERLAKMREIREQMNDIYRVGVKDAKSILEYASDIYGGKDMNKDIYDAWQADTKGPDWVIDHMSDSAKVKWDTVKSEYSSADPQNFVDTYNYFSGLKGDKDENGKTVHDSKRQKFIQWLDNQPYSAAEKQTLYTQVGGYKTEATFKDGGSGTTKSNKDALKEKAEEIQANAKYMPVKEARISSEFGMRDHPISGKRKMHNGIDIAVGTGTDVVSARKGVVEFAGSRGGYGNRVVIDHGDGMKTTYSHLSEIGVKEGDTVNAGTLIAKSGATGGVTGPHLHFEVEVNGSYVNPRDFFDFDSWKTVSIAKNPDYSAYAPTKSSGGGGGGGGRKSGGKKSGGSSGGAKGKATTQAAYTPTYAPTTTRSSGSSGSSYGGSSGKPSGKATRTPAARRTQTSVAKGIMLPTAREIDSAKRTSTPTVARNGGKSASRGIVLPTAAEVASAAAVARIGYGSGTSSIRRTNRSRGSFWHENILG